MSFVRWEAVKARQARGAGESGGGEICGHCGRPQMGASSFGGTPLCHPDYGLDCYRLVSLYSHPMPCGCQGETEHPDMDVCDECGYRRFEHVVDTHAERRRDFLGNLVPCWDFTPKARPAPRARF